MLRGADGSEFCTGVMGYFCLPVFEGAPDTRLFVPIIVDDVRIEAIVDTGATYLILDPGTAMLASLDPSIAIERRRINIRGEVWLGFLCRVPVRFRAMEGEVLAVEMTAFVPEPVPGQVWSLPCFLGWQGCLERIRFAVDPREGAVLFWGCGIV